MRDLTCRCGQMSWTIADNAAGRHLVCYCVDCQAYQHHLGCADTGLDEDGGTHLFQTVPSQLTITRGAEHLAALRLSPKGVMRWHAGCCGTPIGNTLASRGFSFVGAVLPADEDRFGPVRARVNTIGARRKIADHGTLGAVTSMLARALTAGLTGRYKKTPFFDGAGAPKATPRVLTRKERLDATPAPDHAA